jgi:thioredoxin reductase (NADPH)
MKEAIQQVVIVGAGPAGLTAAIYSARAGLRPLVLTGSSGGQLATTSDVENFPGFPEGVTGPELIDKMTAQAKKFGALFLDVSVKRLEAGAHPFVLWLDNNESCRTNSVIVATGASAKYLGLPGESRFVNKGISACATCDGPLKVFRNKVIVVVGGGDSACEEALFLTKFASQVLLVHRRDSLRASKIMIERVETNPKIQILWNSMVFCLLFVVLRQFSNHHGLRGR